MRWESGIEVGGWDVRIKVCTGTGQVPVVGFGDHGDGCENFLPSYSTNSFKSVSVIC